MTNRYKEYRRNRQLDMWALAALTVLLLCTPDWRELAPDPVASSHSHLIYGEH